MATRLHHVLATLALSFGAVSCSSAPETEADAATQDVAAQRDDVPPSLLDSLDMSTPEDVAARPMVESRAAPRPKAVIHHRPAPRPVVDTFAALEPLLDRAIAARDRFDFAAAEDLFRTLRDHADTPRAMRAGMHAELTRCAELAYRLRMVQRALDRREYGLATERCERLERAHPEVPVAALLEERLHCCGMPGPSR